jgi:NAD(P)-dependent dehydrogenase (short-subunit alcohol dehydrogenase family)
MDLDGKVVVVTGGASGIGAALARAFAAARARLVLADIDTTALERTAAELASGGAQVATQACDVGDRVAVEELADTAEAVFGPVDVVCNNAGIALYGEVTSLTPIDWELVMRVNFWGVVHGVDTFVPRMIERRCGHILNTASMAGLVGMQGLGAYCASKFAVVGLSESLHRELRPHGIGVTVLCPMIVDTALTQNSLQMWAAAHGKEEPEVPTAADLPGGMRGGVVSAQEVAARTLEAIRRGDLYVLTHPEQAEILARRAARLADAAARV